MILCVTLNPGLDKTLTVPSWDFGANVRGRAVRAVVGGKGNNVARALRRLGRAEVRPVLFLGGAVGALCEQLLVRDDGLDPLVSPIAAETREILTVRADGPDSPPPTAFFDPDPAVSEFEAEDLFNRVEGAITAGGVEALALSGSSPAPEADGIYADLIGLAKARGVPTFLDTYGPALARLWGFWPDAIGLNRREAAIRLGFDRRPDDDEVSRLLNSWADHGVGTAYVTDGPRPILAIVAGVSYRVDVPEIEPVNPIGSGDSLLAGLIDAHLAGKSPEARLRRAAACGVANALAWDAGAIDLATVGRIEAEVVVGEWP